ncbi:MAG TPA: hypothetical protein GXZ76_05710 [Clostridiaceae bacterium]|nr:hypothetical protein [Clostridiaceae bacterium]
MNTLIIILEKYSIGEGVIVSLFSMLIVFLLLLLLSIIITLLKFIPFQDRDKNAKKPVAAGAQNHAVAISSTEDEEERLVAMLTASCLAKNEIDGDVKVVSVERTK